MSERSSGIELLKVIAIVLIVLSHMIGTLISKSNLPINQDYYVDLSVASTDIRHIMLLLLRGSGMAGNTIFFVCSAWFLLDDDRVNWKKWFFMLFEVWVISIFILGAVFCFSRDELSVEMIKKSIFPSLYGNNWYITCYLLFYPWHRYLNRIIHGMGKRELLGCTLALGVPYIAINYVRPGLLFTSQLIIWTAIYFLVAYVKLYLQGVFSNRRTDILLIILALTGYTGILLLANYLELKAGILPGRAFQWSASLSNPFFLLAVIAAFFLARTSTFHSRAINYISSLSMLIYIIHENILIVTYYRPRVFSYIFSRFGSDHMFLWLALLTAVTFLLSLAVSCVYERFLRKHVRQLSGGGLFWAFQKSVAWIEDAILKLR